MNPGLVPGAGPSTYPASQPGPRAVTDEELLGPANRRVDAAPAADGSTRSAGEPVAPFRPLTIEASVGVTAIADDNVNLTANNKRRDLILQISPRLGVTSRGARHRLNGTVGVDHAEYIRDSKPSATQPVANLALESMLVDNAIYLDAGAQVERRAASAFGPQNSGATSDEQINTGVYRLSPRLDMHPGRGWSALARSDNTWTQRTGAQVEATTDKVYSRRTEAHLNREPEPFGFGIEGSEHSLRYGDDRLEVLNLKSARASLGYRLTPQFSAHVLAGKEHSRFSDRSQTDNDVGMRVRWAPLERSVLSVEARRRFFGNSLQAQWNHRGPLFGLSVGASREPVTQPEALRLAGNGLVEPVTVYVTRPQLATAANALLTVAGRRTVVMLSVYGRRLERLERNGDPVDALLPGDIEQVGSQFSVSFRLTPMVTLDTFVRYDHSESLGGAAASQLESTDTLYSASTSYWLSPHTRFSLGAQHHRLKSSSSVDGGAVGNAGTASVLYKF